MKTLTTSVVASLICAESVSKKRDGSGNFIFREEYFYTGSGSEQ